jgi:hypothetical protein
METVITNYLDNYKQASTGGGEGLGRRNSSWRGRRRKFRIRAIAAQLSVILDKDVISNLVIDLTRLCARCVYKSYIKGFKLQIEDD